MENIYLNVDLNIGIDLKMPYENLFQESYVIQLHKDFVVKMEEKKHNMSSHSKWFRDEIKINHAKEEIIPIVKWTICYINFGMNIGTEINGVRPAVIYKHDNYRFGEDVIVIPMTSYDHEEEKSKDAFGIELLKDESNGLDKNSLIKIRQMRCISKKRLRKKKGRNTVMIVGKIEDENIKKQIDNNVRVMLGI